MSDPPDDPVYRNSRREAILVLVVWALCGIYTLTYCFLHGYDRDPSTLRTYWGIPDWVLFGIITPWFFANVFAAWFSFRVVKDEDLEPAERGEDRESPESPVSRREDPEKGIPPDAP